LSGFFFDEDSDPLRSKCSLGIVFEGVLKARDRGEQGWGGRKEGNADQLVSFRSSSSSRELEDSQR